MNILVKVLIISAVVLMNSISIMSCSSSLPEVKPRTEDRVILGPAPAIDSQRSAEADLDELESPHPKDDLPFEWHVYLSISPFAYYGIQEFYTLHRRVPASFHEYLESGIPMLIPNDYITGEPYQLVDELDMNDTTGFTFQSDGVDVCAFEFVINSNKTGKREVFKFEFDENRWSAFKTVNGVQGFMANSKMTFDDVKRNYCFVTFINYLGAYNYKNQGQLPNSLYEMFADVGVPVEAGWKWAPDVPNFYEFGVDQDKHRYYTQVGCKGVITVRQLYQELQQSIETPDLEGENVWFFFDGVKPPIDVIEMKPMISSDSLYNGYLELTRES